MDLSTISVHSLNRPTTKVATTPAQYAGLMQDLANHMIDSAQSMIDLEHLMTVGAHNAQVIENIEMASVVIEQSVAAPWAVQMVNAGSGFVESLVATEGISINTTTQAERQRLAKVTVEGLGSKIKDAYKKVIAWFKEMWAKFSTWIKNLFNKKARMLAALESQKKRIDAIANPEMDAKKKIKAIPKSEMNEVIKGVIAIIDRAKNTEMSVDTVQGASDELSGRLARISAKEAGPLSSLGYNNPSDVKAAIDQAINVIGKLDSLKEISKVADTKTREGIKASEELMAKTEDDASRASLKAKVAADRKHLTALVKISSKVDSAAFQVAATALKVAKYVKAKA